MCAFLQIKDRKHIEKNVHSVAWVMPEGWDLGGAWWVKNFSLGIVMAHHRLYILVFFVLIIELVLK